MFVIPKLQSSENPSTKTLYFKHMFISATFAVAMSLPINLAAVWYVHQLSSRDTATQVTSVSRRVEEMYADLKKVSEDFGERLDKQVTKLEERPKLEEKPPAPAKTPVVGDRVEKTEKPPFRLEQFTIPEGLLYQSGFTIVSASQKPLTIRSVVYNGDYDAKLVKLVIFGKRMLIDTDNSFPVTLEIGERMNVGWHFLMPDSTDTYPKDVIFVDIVTDQGYFRFTGDGQFIAKKR